MDTSYESIVCKSQFLLSGPHIIAEKELQMLHDIFKDLDVGLSDKLLTAILNKQQLTPEERRPLLHYLHQHRDNVKQRCHELSVC